MAQQITRLLPWGNIDEKDIINEYALNAGSGEAGSFVKVVAGDLSKDPTEYVNSSYYVNRMGNATSKYPTVTATVGLTTGTGDAAVVLGMLMRDYREVDENGEKLHFYNPKKEELQCLLSGEAAPIATRGMKDVNHRAFANGVVPNVNDAAVLAADGKLTGVAAGDRSQEQKDATVGKFIGTGFRSGQQTADAFDGPWARLVFSID
jgi:hypothetical protein